MVSQSNLKKIVKELISFYKKFERYRASNDDYLAISIIPSIKLDQYKIFKDENNEIYGFINWAYLNNKEEKKYRILKKIEFDKWNSGENVWVHNFVSLKDQEGMTNWLQKYFTEKFNIDKTIKWLRLNENNIYSYNEVTTKESWLNND